MPSTQSSHIAAPRVPAGLAPSATSVRDSDGKSYGQVTEYIEDRFYLACYNHPPTDDTPFPYPAKKPTQSPNKRSSKLNRSSPCINIAEGVKPHKPIYFSIDSVLLYNAFFMDFGPLHIGHMYRFSLWLHDILLTAEKEGKVIVLWSYADSRSRANAACLLACYMIILQHWPPHLALAPISQIDPPLMPFRDAGYAQADFILNIQDVIYGVWRAKEEGLIRFDDFDLREYETFERVENGDFNWITPYFVAFASPQHQPADIIKPNTPEYVALPRSTASVMNSKLPSPFKMVLAHFRQKRVGLVVRLNSELYSPSYFSALGMTHLDMIFEDGTCPPLNVVKRFIRIAHDMIVNKKRPIAIHCKAGLGRTGCLIGAYIIYRHGFTANEVIAFMRFMRPGMVVGPQQHWLHLNQGIFRQWWFEDSIKEKLDTLKQSQSTPDKPTTNRRQQLASNGQTFTPPNGTVSSAKRRALSELKEQDTNMSSSVLDENLPAPTPGQPRKTSKLYGERHNPSLDDKNEHPRPQPDTEIITLERHVQPQEQSESDEEYQLRLLANKSTRTPSGGQKRSVSCHTTTMSTRTDWDYPEERNENMSPERDLNGKENVKTASTPRTQSYQGLSGSGAGTLGVSKRGVANGSPVRRRDGSDGHRVGSGGVRKNSGRIGSAGAAGHSVKARG